jgi:hypothetical protein
VRIVVKTLLAVTTFAGVVVSVCLCWFYFYSGDLPNFSALAKFAPDSPATVAYQCSKSPVQVIPSTFVSKNLRNAARAAEGNNEVLARQISFDLFCNSQTKDVETTLTGVQSIGPDSAKVYARSAVDDLSKPSIFRE